jgi:hypothetical protein
MYAGIDGGFAERTQLFFPHVFLMGAVFYLLKQLLSSGDVVLTRCVIMKAQ